MAGPGNAMAEDAAHSSPVAAAMERFRGKYDLALEWVVSALMVVLAVEVMAGVIFRFAGHSLTWYDEVASKRKPTCGSSSVSGAASDEWCSSASAVADPLIRSCFGTSAIELFARTLSFSSRRAMGITR